MGAMGMAIAPQGNHHIVNYLIRYYSQPRPDQHNGGMSPNKVEEKYWDNHQTMWPVLLDQYTLDGVVIA